MAQYQDKVADSNKTDEDSETAQCDNDTKPEWVMAREGINLIINNNHTDAEHLFLRYPDSLVMYAGYSFAVFMDALMSFEEEKLAKAISVLKEVEKRCTNQNGWLKSISQKVFGGSNDNTQTLTEQLETQIILADSQVCLAILTFLQQDISGYFKGGWVLRKAWKVYQKVYKEILTLYKEKIGELQLPDPVLSPLTPTAVPEFADQTGSSEWSVPDTPINGDYRKIDTDTIIRLMGAISFGHGLFQLGVSLLPPSLMRLVSILGFAANRQNGIACLMYARMGVDMRAPLASLALLWYHTIVRPFYAIDGINVQAGVESALVLIAESEKEFSNSALFLFFAGRTNRLNSNISEALTSFQRANDNANQREIKILCLHEIGWCYLIQLDYENAKNTFLYLKCTSRWSKAFYLYLAAICAGATRDMHSYSLFDDLQSCSGGTRGGQLDEFLNRRFECCPKDAESAKRFSTVYFKLLVFEMLYLWNALASCTRANIEKIVSDCDNTEFPQDEPRNGISELILGICLSIQKKNQEALSSFKKCLEKRSHEPNNSIDAHISAFSQFELGYMLIQNEETREEGRLYLQHIEKYSRYDFESRLNVRIHATLKHY
ncbi:tetratricopeptide repeat protein 39C-like isoform X2 [Rhynchophorus ferrugineus]|uniref:tetratricopeptide repeat protein 39C-like isoform X2 n=1 Tax=Rhynchophorus ferrugineus TaxID=354439 RepID=UPI003FCDB744